MHKVIARVDGHDSEPLYNYLIGEDKIPGSEDDQLINSRNHPYYPSPLNPGISMANIYAHVLKITITISRGDSNFLLSAIIKNHNVSSATENNSEEKSNNLEGNSSVKVTDENNNAKLTLEYPFDILLLTENQRI